MATLNAHRCRTFLSSPPAIALLSRCLLAASQLIIIFFASITLSQIEQGVFSTTRSLVALITFFDLGLSVVLTQVIAHMTYENPQSPAIRSQLRPVLLFALRWYGVTTLVASLSIFLLGWYLLSTASELQGINYIFPWSCICASTLLTMLLMPIQAFLEGSGHTVNMAIMRGVQALAGAIAMGMVALVGGGLWCLPALFGTSIIVGWTWIFIVHRHKLFSVLGATSGQRLNWRKDIRPFQWRMALSWMSGWIIYQLYVPVLFVHAGAISAGQMGLTMEACAGITSLGAAWVGIKAPTWGGLVARGDFLELDRQFRTSSRYALFVVIIAAALFGCGIMVLNWIQHPLATRFLPPHALAPLLLAAILNQSVFAMATYLRAHRREPYLAPTVVGAVALGTWTLVAGPLVGATGLAYAHLVVTLIVGWAWGLLIFRHCRTTWHNESAPKAIPSDSTHD